MAKNGVENEEFTYQKGDAELLPALARGESIKSAAKLAGVAERTAARRMSDAAFRRELQRLQGEIIDRSVALISEYSGAAIKKLHDLLKAESETVQLGASRALVDYSLKLREHSEIERLKIEVEELRGLIQGATNQ